MIDEARVNNMIRTGGFDVIVASSRENVLYLSGTQNMSHDLIGDRPHYVIWPADSPPTYIVIKSEAEISRSESRIKDHRTYMEFEVAPEDLVCDILREKGLDTKRIGIEWKGCTKHAFDHISSGLKSNDIRACDDLLGEIRAIKTEAEIELMTRATQATERAVMAAFAGSRPGDSERDIHNRIAKNLIDYGCHHIAWLVLGAGEKSKIVHPKAGDYRPKRGEMIHVDVGAWFDGYLSDIGRVAVVGEPSALQTACYRKLRKAERAGIDAVRPGARMGDVYDAIHAAIGTGEPKVTLRSFPHFGHSIGVGLHEHPMLSRGSDAILEPNMVLCVEPSFKDDNGDVYHIEETVRVTKTGCEVLTYMDGWDDLFVIK